MIIPLDQFNNGKILIEQIDRLKCFNLVYHIKNYENRENHIKINRYKLFQFKNEKRIRLQQNKINK